MSDLEDRLKEALAQVAHGLFASAPAKAKAWDQLSDDMRDKFREQFAAPLVAGILPIVQSELDCKSVVHVCCEWVENVREVIETKQYTDGVGNPIVAVQDLHEALDQVEP